MRALDIRRAAYVAGDTDLAWTRLTPWRALVASTLDQPFGRVTGASISVQRSNPSGALLASWLQHGLDVPVEIHHSRGPGITGVTLRTDRGDIAITRPDGRVARMVRPGFPYREAPLRRRSVEALIAEELRRLDPDEIYGETLDGLPALAARDSRPGARRPAVAPTTVPDKGGRPARKAMTPAKPTKRAVSTTAARKPAKRAGTGAAARKPVGGGRAEGRS